ncbi:DUF7336 domain-containing protein [Sphingomonas kyeonggiensis]|uniref:DUF7336 domain-containing protein n=1 Tax=Sphingomonas kyeonggiensis TaxID=1268553 RepID=A0A7W6NV37_9SPHN|nr:hypothetical protein [Sphingomonas kyeonggiensis]MBB4097027.1 hypothetical protein [Sphingomonas kyeonggiensis]
MSEVFLLWHSRELGNDETDDKLVGVYSSHAEAQAAIARKLAFPGFRDHPDGFLIDRSELDRDAWSEGFGLGED